MTEVISVRFKDKGKVYFFDPNGVTAELGDHLIVETSKGMEYAECAQGNHEVDDAAVIPPLRPVLRVATEADVRQAAENKVREKEAFEYCQQRIEKHALEMKLVDVEYSFEGSKILFFFTADGRVDFRELVKDLASMFKTRIELRQIGVRDEARMLGGLGICGRPFCCSQFLDEFHPVSIKMAKTQGLSLNPTKISGTCGRLMCCLKYEQCAYEELVKKAPKPDAFVETPAGKGSVAGVNLLRGYAKVRLEEGNDTTLKTFDFGDLEVLGGKARRAEYLTAKAEGRLEEAGFKETPREPKLAAEPAPRPEKRREPRRQEQKPQQTQDTGRPQSAQEPKRQEQRKQEPRKRPQRSARPQKQEANADIRAIAESAAREAAQNQAKRHRRGGRGRSKGPEQKNEGGEPKTE